MRVVKPRKKSLLWRLALVALSVYVVVALVQLQLQLNEDQQRPDEMNERLEEQSNINAMLEDKLKNTDEHLEQQARKQGLAKPGETILVEIPSE